MSYRTFTATRNYGELIGTPSETVSVREPEGHGNDEETFRSPQN